MGYRLVDSKTGKILEQHSGSFREFLTQKYGGLFPVRMPGESVPRSYKYLGSHREDAYWEPAPDKEES